MRIVYFYKTTSAGNAKRLEEFTPPVLVDLMRTGMEYLVQLPEFKNETGEFAIITPGGAPYIADAQHIRDIVDPAKLREMYKPPVTDGPATKEKHVGKG